MLLKFVSHFLLVWNETPRFIPSSPVIWSQNWTWRKCRGHLHRRSLMPTQIFTPVPILIILIIPIIKAQHRFDARIMVGKIAANICIRQSRIPVFCRIFEPTHQSQNAPKKNPEMSSAPKDHHRSLLVGLPPVGLGHHRASLATRCLQCGCGRWKEEREGQGALGWLGWGGTQQRGAVARVVFVAFFWEGWGDGGIWFINMINDRNIICSMVNKWIFTAMLVG